MAVIIFIPSSVLTFTFFLPPYFPLQAFPAPYHNGHVFVQSEPSGRSHRVLMSTTAFLGVQEGFRNSLGGRNTSAKPRSTEPSIDTISRRTGAHDSQSAHGGAVAPSSSGYPSMSSSSHAKVHNLKNNPSPSSQTSLSPCRLQIYFNGERII